MRSRALGPFSPTWSLVLAGVVACHADAPAASAPPAPPPPPPAWAPPSQPPARAVGPACAPEGTYACAPDRTGMLQCQRGVFVVASSCRGARGCVDGAAIACDTSTAMQGDPCDTPNATSCGTDRRTLLRCTNGRFSPAEACRNACLSTAGRVLCQ